MSKSMKKIKYKIGWAVLNDKGKILYIHPYRSKPNWFYIGSWSFPVESADEIIKVKIIPYV